MVARASSCYAAVPPRGADNKRASRATATDMDDTDKHECSSVPQNLEVILTAIIRARMRRWYFYYLQVWQPRIVCNGGLVYEMALLSRICSRVTLIDMRTLCMCP